MALSLSAFFLDAPREYAPQTQTLTFVFVTMNTYNTDKHTRNSDILYCTIYGIYTLIKKYIPMYCTRQILRDKLCY